MPLEPIRKSTDNYYGPAAFRGRCIPPLPFSNRSYGGVLNTPLKWGDYAYLDSPIEIKEQLKDAVQLQRSERENKKSKTASYCSAEKWSFENKSKIPKLLFLLRFISFSMPWCLFTIIIFSILRPNIFLITFFGVALAILSMDWGLTKRERWGKISVFSGAAISTAVFLLKDKNPMEVGELTWILGFSLALTFMAVIGCDLLTWCYSRFYRHDGSGFNRRTGMVTIDRRFRKPFVAPFYEFDPVMQLMVTPHGSKDYGLWLHHRYSSQKVGLAGIWHSFGLDKQNIYALWDTLQRYMDVEQPLPDLPVLEQSRHLDPTTVEADKRHKRPPRRWRDLDVKAWLRSRDEREQRTRVMGYPWQQQPCTLRARFDPKLDVETYYQQQREMGIYATPKPEDYDNIHRPKLKIFQDKNRAGN